MRTLKMMLVGLLLLIIQLPNVEADRPVRVSIYFSIIDEADEIFRKSSFKVEGVHGATVSMDHSRKALWVSKTKLKKYFVVVLPLLLEGKHAIRVTVTDKGGLTASKIFVFHLKNNYHPNIEIEDAPKDSKKANTRTSSSTR